MTKILFMIGLLFAAICAIAAPPEGFTLMGKDNNGITWYVNTKSVHEVDLHVGKQPLPIVVFKAYVEINDRGEEGYLAANCDMEGELWITHDPNYDYTDNDLDNHDIIRGYWTRGTVQNNIWGLVCTLNNMKALENGLDKTFPQEGENK